MDLPLNDNRAAARALPDADGQAALLLVESLIHCLVGHSVISLDDAIDVVGTAADAAAEIEDDDERSRANQSPATMLKAIGESLSHDR